VTAIDRGPIRIAYVLPYLVAGGTEGHVLSLVRRIDRQRFLPLVVALGGGGELEPTFRKEGIPVHVLGRIGVTPRPGQWGRMILDALGCVRTLSGILRSERPDILHTYLPTANVLGPISGRLTGVPRVIVSKRALADYKDRFPMLRRVEPLGNRLADAILVNSDAVQRDIERTERHWEGKFRKIHNGVAPFDPWMPEETMAFRRREGIPADALVALCVSNFYPYKGHEELVDAAARIVPAFPNIIFLLVGRDSGTMEATKERVRERGIEGSVRFVGSRTDVPDLLRASDLFVHPSREEGFSNAILEAMAAGLPVVACDVGGNPEAVVDGETGRLVPSRNAAAFASAVTELLTDPKKRKAMGEAGRLRAVERFSLDRMVGEMESLYESLARGGR
jgi:glycosyltransferase involved in cell wall biosynthesis